MKPLYYLFLALALVALESKAGANDDGVDYEYGVNVLSDPCSPTYLQSIPLTKRHYGGSITVPLYHRIFNRVPIQAELDEAHYNSTKVTCAAFRVKLASRFEAFRQIEAIFMQVLERHAIEGAYWQTQLKNGSSIAQIRRSVASAPEAQNKLKTLYKALVGRDAEASGLAFFTERLASGYSLSQVRTFICYSPEYLKSHGNVPCE